MSKLECDKQKNHSVRNAAIIFALIIIGVYAPLIFLNQTYLINNFSYLGTKKLILI